MQKTKRKRDSSKARAVTEGMRSPPASCNRNKARKDENNCGIAAVDATGRSVSTWGKKATRSEGKRRGKEKREPKQTNRDGKWRREGREGRNTGGTTRRGAGGDTGRLPLKGGAGVQRVMVIADEYSTGSSEGAPTCPQRGRSFCGAEGGATGKGRRGSGLRGKQGAKESGRRELTWKRM